jgi:hypothetical protein
MDRNTSLWEDPRPETQASSWLLIALLVGTLVCGCFLLLEVLFDWPVRFRPDPAALETRNEITQLSAAVQLFKTKYGV